MALIEFEDLPSTDTPINSDNLNEIQKALIYQSEELEIGVYDNQKLYRRLIIFNKTTGSSTLGQLVNVSHGISNIDKIFVDKEHSFIWWNNNNFIFNPYIFATEPTNYGKYLVDFSASKTDASYYMGEYNVTEGSTMTIYIVIEYTKTN